MLFKGSDRETFHGTNPVLINKAITESNAVHHVAGLGVDLGDVLWKASPQPQLWRQRVVRLVRARHETEPAVPRAFVREHDFHHLLQPAAAP